MRTLRPCGQRPPNIGRNFPGIVRVLTGASLFGFLLTAAAPAFADPVRIVTSGNIYQLVEDGETGAAFFGSGFALTSAEVDIIPAELCSPCTPGRTLDLSTTIRLSAFPPGSAIVDGTTYDEVFFGGRLDINAGSVIVPDVAVGGPYSRLGTAFTFIGTLQGFADVTRTGTPLFSLLVMGGGQTSLGFFNYPTQNGITTDGWQLEFDQAAATPEPGSLLLFASGAAWLGRRWKVQRSAAVSRS
jgi:hypothetical protein